MTRKKRGPIQRATAGTQYHQCATCPEQIPMRRKYCYACADIASDTRHSRVSKKKRKRKSHAVDG